MYVKTYVLYFPSLQKLIICFLKILNNNLYFGLILPMRAVGYSVAILHYTQYKIGHIHFPTNLQFTSDQD